MLRCVEFAATVAVILRCLRLFGRRRGFSAACFLGPAGALSHAALTDFILSVVLVIGDFAAMEIVLSRFDRFDEASPPGRNSTRLASGETSPSLETNH